MTHDIIIDPENFELERKYMRFLSWVSLAPIFSIAARICLNEQAPTLDPIIGITTTEINTIFHRGLQRAATDIEKAEQEYLKQALHLKEQGAGDTPPTEAPQPLP